MRLFRSIRFNVLLFLILAISSAVGTFLPQIGENPEKVGLFLTHYPRWGAFLQTLGFFDLYHTYWFMGLLGLMAFNIVVCKLWKTPPDAHAVTLPPELAKEAGEETLLSRKEAAILQMPLNVSLISHLSPEQALAEIRAFFAGRGYRPSMQIGDPHSRSAVLISRHAIQRWGSYIAHVSLVVILAGALVKGLWGFEEMVPVLEGRSQAMQNKPWEVHVDEFTVQYYQGTLNPKLFASKLRVTEGENLLGAKRIVVNDPLDIGGTRFYQASWGAGGMFRKVSLKMGDRNIEASQRNWVPIQGTPIRVMADMLLPNFVVASGNRADTESLDLKNPAVRFKFSVGGRQTAPIWLFLHWPDVCFAEDPDGALRHAPAPPFRLAHVDPVLFSGIQVAYDPGFPIVMGGSLGWLAGTVLLFYLHRRRFWILIEPMERKESANWNGGGEGEVGGSRVLVGAWSSRGTREFKKGFETLMLNLQQRISAKPIEESLLAEKRVAV